MLVANTDALTGIGNRRRVLAQLFERLGALHSPVDLLCVVVADLDQFKHIDDRFGHPAGDLITVFRRAALALYQAKQAGRNRTVRAAA